ncbi:MAG: TIR domain-containing protein [Bacteroidota bacterium]
MNPVNLFISHVSKDEEYKDQLLRHLSSLIRKGWIEAWHYQKVGLGKEKEATIRAALNGAEIILFLISADFMANDEIQARDVRMAVQRSHNQQTIVLPILIRACDYSSEELEPFQAKALPKDKNAICSWDSRDAAWLNVVNGISEAVRQIRGNALESIAEEEVGPTPTVVDTGIVTDDKKTLSSFHRFTCDRIQHSQDFKDVFNKKERTQFFYLYGGDMQSHLGMFNRITYDLEGRMQDYLNPGLRYEHQALRIELTFDPSDDMKYYKENVLKSLFAGFCIPVNEHGPLTEKDLAFAYQKSANLKGLKPTDYACIFISISDYEWHPELTPGLTRWFINDFCNCRLPLDAPNFLFFFAIKYEDEDEELKEEIEDIIGQSKNIKRISELNMVRRRDIRGWFNKYAMVAPNGRERKALMKFHFNQEKEFYMDDVEIAFQQIIDEYNQTQQ